MPARKQHPALIDERVLLHLLVALIVQAHGDGVAQRSSHAIVLGVAHLGHEIELYLAAIALLGPLQRARSELGGNRHEDLVGTDPELGGLDGDRQLDLGNRRVHGVLQLALAIFGREDAEGLGRVIALAVADARTARNSVDLHAERAPAAVVRGVAAVVAEQVVAGEIALHVREGFAEVAQIEEALAAGVGGEGGQSFPGILTGILLMEDRSSLKHGLSRGRAHAGIAAGNFSHEAARIDGVDGDVGAIGGVGGGFQLGAIVFASLGDAAGELQHRLLAGDFAEQIGDGFERGELAVGVEDIELGFVGGEGRVEASADRGFYAGGGSVQHWRARDSLPGTSASTARFRRSLSLVKSATTCS